MLTSLWLVRPAGDRLGQPSMEAFVMRSVRSRGLVAGLLMILAAMLVAAGCGSSSSSSGGGSNSGGGGATPVNTSTCQKVVGSGKYEIVSDFPLQGASQHQTNQMNQAIELVLKENNYKAGNVTLQFQPCDDSTAQLGSWDSGTCSSNANAYARDPSVIGEIGTFN